MNAKQEIVSAQAAAPAATTPMDMIASAIERGLDTTVIGQLMELEERWRKNQGRRAFDQAVADAKALIPVIAKNRTGHNNKRYADFAAIAKEVDPILGAHGLSYRFRTKQDDKAIYVTCVLSHRDGHSEETTLAGPSDTTGNKNAIQAIGSTLTYLQRYSLTQMLGLAASEDDDGAASEGVATETITAEQAATLEKYMTENDVSVAKFCKGWKIAKVGDLAASDYAEATAQAQRVVANRDATGGGA